SCEAEAPDALPEGDGTLFHHWTYTDRGRRRAGAKPYRAGPCISGCRKSGRAALKLHWSRLGSLQGADAKRHSLVAIVTFDRDSRGPPRVATLTGARHVGFPPRRGARMDLRASPPKFRAGRMRASFP